MKKVLFCLIIIFFTNFLFSQQTNITPRQPKKETSKYLIEILSKKEFNVNEVPKLLISVKEDNYILKNLKISAGIITPSGKTFDFVLNDAGAYGDLKAKDGIASSFLVGLNESGKYSIGIQIKGKNFEDKPISLVTVSSLIKKNYARFPITTSPAKVVFRNAVVGVRNASGFQLISKSKKRYRILVFATHLYSGKYKIYNWQVRTEPFSIRLKPFQSKRVDIFVTPDKYAKEGIYKGYIILDMLSTAMKVPVSFEILENKNLTVWRRIKQSSSFLSILIYIIIIVGLSVIGYIIFKNINKQKNIVKSIIIDDGESKTEFKLDKDEFSIGREKGSDIELFDTSVSRNHCVIKKEGIRFKIIDNNSTNGIFLNGKKIKESFIKKGDKIIIGKFKLNVI